MFIYVFPFSTTRRVSWFQRFVCLMFPLDCFGEAAGDLAAASCFLFPVTYSSPRLGI